MVDFRLAPWALLLLRVSLGALFLAHAGMKLFVLTPHGTAVFFSSVGLPPWLAYVDICWELVGGLALVGGLWPRRAALAMVPVLIGAIATVHGTAGFFFNDTGGGWAYPAFWIIALLVVALGGGVWAVLPTTTGRGAI